MSDTVSRTNSSSHPGDPAQVGHLMFNMYYIPAAKVDEQRRVDSVKFICSRFMGINYNRWLVQKVLLAISSAVSIF